MLVVFMSAILLKLAYSNSKSSGKEAGVRRIEALTGKAAFLYLEDIQEKFNTMKSDESKI